MFTYNGKKYMALGGFNEADAQKKFLDFIRNGASEKEAAKAAMVGVAKEDNSLFGNLLSGNIGNWVEKQIDSSPYLKDLVNGMTGAGLTTRDIELNKLNQQNVVDQAALQKQGFQNAGFNPALMYGNMASAPTAQSTSVDGSIIDKLLSVIFARKQYDLLNKQIEKTGKESEKLGMETDKISTEIDFQKLVNAYYPDLTEAQISQIYRSMEVQDADIDLKGAQAAFQRVQTAIAKIDKTFKSDYWKAQIDNLKASSESARASAAAALAKKAIDELEAKYMKEYNMHMGSNDYVALAASLSRIFGADNDSDLSAVVGKVKEYAKKGVDAIQETAKGAVQRHENRTWRLRNKLGELRFQYKRFVNRHK